MLLLFSSEVSKFTFSKITSRSSSLDPDQDVCSVSPDLGPSYLQR